ncbi:acetolactate synthase large subunit [Parasulfitobacter algicola]|uniref:Acetolactate synthase large subunit n=1 Tax=Parasulfitobacter algicola TaxID=2614809 RepID=A0ABX2IM99_9RHOB|nr:acetolactate synthase large subunit [Sulfitobacter algicola]NSX54004.1 acetolactate synthase large subunit [Sulfitobacter algicola]
MTGAELFVKCLQAAGIEVIYGIPGEENTDLMLAIDQSDIRFVLVRHEQAAAFMASVYGRMTGKPAGCLATLGPGATNLVTGVADATLDFVPLVAISAQGEVGRMQMSESHQVIDLDALFKPITKMSQTILNTQSIPGTVAEAVRVACAERPGAVHLSLPVDVAGTDVDASPITVTFPKMGLPDPKAVLAAAQLLRGSSQPIVVAGAGVVRAQAHDQLQYFAESLKLPVATSFMGKGLLPADHELNIFSLGQPYEDHIDTALGSADLIIAIGFDPIEYSPSKLTNGGRVPVLHLAETPAAIDVGWAISCDVTGSLSATLKGLVAALSGHQWDLWSEVADVQNRMRSDRATCLTASDADVMRAEDVLAVVEQQLETDDWIISGVGTHKLKVARNLAPKRAGQVIIANGLAGMGLALPGVIAAADLQDTGHVMAICGDGDFMMNVQDMETAARLDLPVTVMVWEDKGYGLIKAKQEADADTHTELSFENPDWGYLAKAFGWQHIPVDQFSQLEGILKDAKAATGPVLITLAIDYGNDLQPPSVDAEKPAA